MSDIAIRVENLSKRYRIGRAQQRHDTLRDSLAASLRGLRQWGSRNGQTPPDDFWALKDVSFEVKQGEVVGIIGRNGAGKSTLLKILSQITEPTSGRVELHGRVASLLEVGTGFHPELSGRENVYLSGTILGMKKVEIDRKFEEIVNFAGVEKFIDMPVKRYSSGMNVRLGFAVAAHLEPEVLLVDEVLAVGDVEFQRKCLGKMEDVAKEGRTVLFVSHNMIAIISLCSRVFLLDTGGIVCEGATKSVVEKYLQNTISVAKIPLIERTDRMGNGNVRLVSLSVQDSFGNNTVRCNDSLKITIGFASNKKIRKPTFLIGVFDGYSRRVYFLDSRDAGWGPESIVANGTIVCITGPINLIPGKATLNIAMLEDNELVDHIVGAYSFDVAPDDFFGTGRIPDNQTAICLLPQRWQLDD